MRKFYFMGFVGECLKALACYIGCANLLWLAHTLADFWSAKVFKVWPILGHTAIFMIAVAVLLGGLALSNITRRWRKEDMKKKYKN